MASTGALFAAFDGATAPTHVPATAQRPLAADPPSAVTATTVRSGPSSGRAAVRIGHRAAAALAHAANGEVIAVFRSSSYLRSPGGLVCLGGVAIGDGPLNLIHPDAVPEALARLSPGMAFRLLPSRVLALPGLSLSLAEAVTWTPPALGRRTRGNATAAAALIASMLPPDMPREGLGALIRTDAKPDGLVQHAASTALDALTCWATEIADAPPPQAAIAALLGLGPGLTPSGDDALSGFAVGLTLLGRTAAQQQLARAVQAEAPRATNEISIGHMQAAMQGGLSADLHRVIDAALSADQAALATGLVVLAKCGHSSPWDALAGLTAALRGKAT